ncbi:hypothetical protein [Mangrovibacterium diazotrophicum]|uniref:Carbohydrate-binding family V/XII n=1 Tax=Mangrovibacterium diazotrophicum TaxID=1261403 RepID=A0A419W4E1_9BACT|nr:hypothetical protein [Mangrovibacterium diazotrophicum]RKD90318.1 hypothetical protein BC643_0655 [Mangrovibacterium diazotrophicum]
MKYLNLLLVLIFFAGSVNAKSDYADWPKTITNSKGVLTMYQPQLESLEGTTLSGRAAISVKVNDSEPVFGAVWITTTLETDRDSRMSTLTNIKVPNVKFADDVSEANLAEIKTLIEEEMPKWELVVPLDEIITTLEAESGGAASNYQNDPPEIIVAYKPSILVFIDGDPILKDMEGYPYQQIENSPFFILFDKSKKTYYLYGEQLWYSTKDLNGNWSNVKNPSSQLLEIQQQLESSDETEETETTSSKKEATVADIIVRNKPAELIQIDGEANFVPAKGTDLLYVKNSDDNIILDIQSQNYYILVSGRWYSSKSMSGPWSYVDTEKLPEQFSKIEEGSDLDVVLASVPGTNAAREAVLDAQIPQTAQVERSSASVEVSYDGKPDFQKVDGTNMMYAVNSPQTVLKLSNRYYCVDNGVWFESTKPEGPWTVATERPEEVKDIEPSSPVYNVKYVYIYDVTPQYVWVGYTPGYYGCYVYGPTVIYGTGYYYRPWYGAYYYPRPWTFGFRMTYNPWTGWSMHVGFSYGGWFYAGFGGPHYGHYWGPPRYRPPYYHRPPNGGYYGHRPRPTHPQRPPRDNIYSSRPGVRPTTNQRPPTTSGRTRDTNRSTRQNNVYTDRNGQVYQKTDKGWQTRENNSWKSVDNKGNTRDNTRPATTRPSQPSNQRPSTGTTTTRPTTRPATSNTGRPATSTRNSSYSNQMMLDRANQSRQRSVQRTNTYNRSVAPARSGAATNRRR